MNTILCASVSAFLETADAARIVDYLTDEVECVEQGFAAMRWLKAHRPAMAARVLCYLYDVHCYKTGETCFRDTAPVEEHDKWFVSVLADSEFEGVDTLPLTDSLEAAEALAVDTFALEKLFYGAGIPEPA